ncbi:hypothetical protein BKA70DRAFT_1472535 [Coprinopsis sp. MPI-PUGE-AT-0042]|nr:hypothetical protein BKA70DRAFT_1472535 [Coprinopsis sp. MPI-PUGE-AT-0042]
MTSQVMDKARAEWIDFPELPGERWSSLLSPDSLRVAAAFKAHSGFVKALAFEGEVMVLLRYNLTPSIPKIDTSHGWVNIEDEFTAFELPGNRIQASHTDVQKVRPCLARQNALTSRLSLTLARPKGKAHQRASKGQKDDALLDQARHVRTNPIWCKGSRIQRPARTSVPGLTTLQAIFLMKRGTASRGVAGNDKAAPNPASNASELRVEDRVGTQAQVVQQTLSIPRTLLLLLYAASFRRHGPTANDVIWSWPLSDSLRRSFPRDPFARFDARIGVDLSAGYSSRFLCPFQACPAATPLLYGPDIFICSPLLDDAARSSTPPFLLLVIGLPTSASELLCSHALIVLLLVPIGGNPKVKMLDKTTWDPPELLSFASVSSLMRIGYCGFASGET